MIIQLCRLVKEVAITKTSFNGEEKSVFNNTIAIKLDKTNSVFIDVVAWGATAETMSKYFKKGDELLIKGELRNKKLKIEDKEITTTFILIQGFEFTYGNKQAENITNVLNNYV